MFTARYGLSPYVTQTRFVFKSLINSKIFVWIPYFLFVLHKESIVMDNIRMYHIDLSDNFISNKIIIAIQITT
jgi:hypothetical protein